MMYVEDTLSLFNGQLSVADIKSLSFGELEALRRYRQERLKVQANSPENRAMEKSMKNMQRSTRR